MAVARHTLTYNFADLLGVALEPEHTIAWVETNLETTQAVVDTSTGGTVMVGSQRIGSKASLGATVDLLPTDSTDLIPTDFQYRIWVSHRSVFGGKVEKKRWTSGWFSFTADADLKDIVEEFYAPPTYLTQLTTALDDHEAGLEAALTAHEESLEVGLTAFAEALEPSLEAYVDSAYENAQAAEASATDAEAAAALAVDISNISTPDALVGTLVSDTVTPSATRTALNAAMGTALLDYIPKGANVLTDGGFEVGPYTGLPARFSVVTGNAYAGTKSMQMSSSGAVGLYQLASTAVLSGQAWKINAWVKTSADFAGEAKIRLANSTTQLASLWFGRSTDWRRVELVYLVPAGAATPLLWQLAAYHTAGTVWVDDVSIRLVDLSIAPASDQLNTFELAVGAEAVAASSRILRSSDDERAALTPDGRTEVVFASGQTDQTWSVTNCTASNDTTRFKAGTQSKRFTTASAVTATALVDPIFPGPAADPYPFAGASLVRAWVWLDDASKVSSVGIDLYNTVALTSPWSRSATVASGALRTGWNLVSFKATSGVVTDWGTLYRARFVVVTTAATSFNVGRAWFECPPKAQILFIEDRGYKTFVDNGLADLRSRNIPVTWALDPMTHGTQVGTKNEVITDADVATYYAAGDDMSIHAYDGAATSGKTPDAIRRDTIQALKWLSDRGYTRGNLWRAAWTQNLATNGAAAKPYFAAYATPSDSAGLETWPFLDRWNVGRISLQGRSTATIDSYFTQLQQAHGLLVCYTHGIHTDGLTNGGADMTPTEWAYFLTKLDAGISGGWLEGVTFSQLLARSGGVLCA